MLLPLEAIKTQHGELQIFLPYVISNLPDRHSKASGQWFDASMRRLLRGPKNLLECCSMELLNGVITPRDSWIPVMDALALLACTPDSYMNQALMDEIRLKTHLEIPRLAGRSEHEGLFAAELLQITSKIEENTSSRFNVVPQKHFNDRRYRVDFFVRSSKTMRNGDVQQKLYVIEYDEPFHEEKKQKEKDIERDKWFRKHRPDVKVIRVKHEERDKWLGCFRGLKELRTLDEYKVHCIKAASEIRPKTNLRVITSESAKAAYDEANNGCACLLSNIKRPFVELAGILKELDVTYSQTDRIFVTRGGKHKM